MINILYTLVFLLLPLLIGYSLTLYLTRKNPFSRVFSLAVGYGLGTGILTQWMLLLGVLEVPLTPTTINAPLLLLLFIFIFLLQKKGINASVFRVPKINLLKKPDFLSVIMTLYISLYFAYIFWRAFNVPIFAWDAFSVYALQAKVFFYEQSLQYHPSLPHYTYPLHTPLLQAWITLNLGIWDDQVIKLFYPFYLLSYAAIQYSFMKKFTTARWALFSLILLLSSSFLVHHATIAYRDIIMLYYNCTCVILLLNWSKTRDKNILFLISLMAGLMTFNKLEGIGYFIIYIIIVGSLLITQRRFSIKEKVLNFLRFTVPCLTIFLFYQIYLTLAVLPKSNFYQRETLSLSLHKIRFQLSVVHIEKAWIVGKNLLNNLFCSNNWGIVWLILIVSLLNTRKTRYIAETKFLIYTLALFFGMYFCGYVFTQHYYWATQTNTVISRGILPLYPLATMLIILINFSNSTGTSSDRIKT